MTDTWTCSCGKYTLDVEPGRIMVGYTPPIPEGATTYEFHASDSCDTKPIKPEDKNES